MTVRDFQRFHARQWTAAAVMLLAGASAAAAPAPREDLLAHATAERCWFAVVSDDPARAPQPQTTLRVRGASGDEVWRPLGTLARRVVALADYRSDLAVLFDDGEWMLVWRGGQSSGRRLPGGRVSALAGGADALWAIGPAPPPTTAPTTSPATAPARSETRIITTAPSSPAPALYSLERNDWKLRSLLPATLSIKDDAVVSMAVLKRTPLIAATQRDGAVRVVRFDDDTGWAELGSVRSSVPVAAIKLMGDPSSPTLWVAGAAGAGALYKRVGQSWTGPIELQPPAELSGASGRDVTQFAERLRLFVLRDEKVFEQVYSDEGVPQRAPAEIAVSTPPQDNTIGYWLNMAVMVALIVVILRTIRRRGPRRDPAE